MGIGKKHAFGGVFDQFTGIVKDYVGGRSEAYQNGIQNVANAYMETLIDQLVAQKEGLVTLVAPSTALVVVPDLLHRLHEPDIDSLQPEIFSSVVDDFEAAIRANVVALVPNLSFLEHGGRSANLFVFVFAQIVGLACQNADKFDTAADIIASLPTIPLAAAENIAVEVISKFVLHHKKAGQTSDGLFDEALSVIQAIRKSGSPRSEQAVKLIEKVEGALFKEVHTHETPATVFH